MEKKNYSKPYAAVECFTPNQYVAACEPHAEDLPSIVGVRNFFIDGWDNGASRHAHTPDGASAGTESVTGDMKDTFPGAWKGKTLREYLAGNSYHLDQGYKEIHRVNPGPSIHYTDYYFEPVILIHVGKGQFYYLADGIKKRDDPWDYVTPSMKNQS